jgi:hypothetical protein
VALWSDTSSGSRTKEDTVTRETTTQFPISPRLQKARVERYLNALDAVEGPPQVDPVNLEEAIALLDVRIEASSDIEQLALVQRRINLREQLAEISDRESQLVELEELEDGFVEVAAEWAAAQGISYEALHRVGVPASVLDRTGIPNPLRKQMRRP